MVKQNKYNDGLTPNQREFIWNSSNAIIEDLPSNLCKSDFPGTDYGSDDEYKIDKWKLCENDLSIGLPTPDREKTEQITEKIFVDGVEVERNFTKPEDKRRGIWTVMLIIEAVLIIFADLSVLFVVLGGFYFNPILNIVIDAIAMLFIFVMHGPIALLGIGDLIPDFLGESPAALIEIFPFFLTAVIIRIPIRNNKFKKKRALEAQLTENLGLSSMTQIYQVNYGEIFFDNFDRQEYMSGKIKKKTKFEQSVETLGFDQPQVPVQTSKKSKSKSIL
ncbi:MAG: hypothetical protein ACXAC7_24325 [Candidatus Hodarchaeales archaeon]|jgi:hypothetical protein